MIFLSLASSGGRGPPYFLEKPNLPLGFPVEPEETSSTYNPPTAPVSPCEAALHHGAAKRLDTAGDLGRGPPYVSPGFAWLRVSWCEARVCVPCWEVPQGGTWNKGTLLMILVCGVF